MDRGVLRQPEIDQQFGPVRGGKELARHLTQRRQGGDEGPDRHRDGKPAGAHGQRQEASIKLGHAARFVDLIGLGRL